MSFIGQSRRELRMAQAVKGGESSRRAAMFGVDVGKSESTNCYLIHEPAVSPALGRIHNHRTDAVIRIYGRNCARKGDRN